MIKNEKHNSFTKLLRITAWIYRFGNNLEKKITKNEILLQPFVAAAELRSAEFFWLKENPKYFDKKKLKILFRDLKLINDEYEFIRCESRLKFAPLPYEAKIPYLISTEHYLADLIVRHLHGKLNNILIKQILAEIRQKYWICRGRNFIRKILKTCVLCRKYEGPPYQCPATLSLTKLQLNDAFAFFLTGIDNLGPLYVKPISFLIRTVI